MLTLVHESCSGNVSDPRYPILEWDATYRRARADGSVELVKSRSFCPIDGRSRPWAGVEDDLLELISRELERT